ncbi:hypothetical protein ACHRV5_19005 [Flavobacterium sp. FlaQc-52]|jgi:hypothetical protein|uniref:hypothetical protein n=1 Tax=Flavobacterium sp. FlaQc-52 TaxID=3374185 RepID=UPI0037577613
MPTNINIILSWFKTGKKPTEKQFWDSWLSFWHKDEQISQKNITNLVDTLNNKVETDLFNSHQTDETAHAQLFAKTKIVKPGEFIVFKVEPNTADYLEIGDSVIGYCQDNFLCEATYYGGDTSLMTSFTKLNNKVGRIVSFTSNDSSNDDFIIYELNNEVLLRSLSCGAYSGVYLMYKKPGEQEFSNAWFNGTYPKTWVTWFEFTAGTVIKLIDTIGGLEDSEEFIIGQPE